MLKGIAKAGDSGLPQDRQGIVVALSNLSKILGASEADSTFAVVAETVATLLRVPRAVIFLKREGDALTMVGSAGTTEEPSFAAGARKIAEDGVLGTGPIMLSNVFADTSLSARELAKAGVASVLCVPLRVGRANVGAIVAMSDTLRAFSSSDVELLHMVASQTALKAWRDVPESETETQAELIRLAQRKIQELSLINQVSGAVSSTLDLEELLDIALEQSMLAVGADTGSLMLVHEETGRLEIAASRGLPQKTVESTSQQVGTSVAGWVAEHGESVLVSNAHTDERFRMPFFRDDITSAASVPLRSKSAVIGVLNVNTTQADRRFDERDLELLGTVANELAVAIDNARLYARVNRRTKQLDSLLSISKTVTSTLNLDELLRRLADEITKLFGLDACVLMLLDDLSGRLRLGYGSGLKTRRRYAYYDLASPLAAHVGKTGKKLLVRDIRNSKNLTTDISEREGLRSVICLPLKNAGKLVGVAVGFTKEVRTFPRSQREIMRPLGELAGVAIRNARVYRQKYKMAEILTQRLVPSSIPEIDGLDIGHKFMPAHEVGGDYYDFLQVGPGKLGIVVADVSGHDVEAAEYTTMGKHVIRAYAREHASPARVLGNTNDLICEDTRAEVFISAFYGVLDLEKKKLRYANAGCERPILYRPSDGTASHLAADGMLLGIRARARFEEREIDLRPGDIIAMFTDGLTEAGVEKSRFGAERVISAVASNARFDAQQIADAISNALFEFVHGRVTDDVAIVIVKVT
jgi:GAF domain-containing protein